MRATWVVMLMMSIGWSPLYAEQPEPVASPEISHESGVDTRRWLSIQRNGEQQSHNPQALSAGAEDRVMRRYLNSFEHPIPDQYYDRNRFASGK